VLEDELSVTWDPKKYGFDAATVFNHIAKAEVGLKKIV